MWHYPAFDPVAISLGPVSIHWYALSYLVGIGSGWWLVRWRTRRYGLSFTSEQISDLAFYLVLGVILGGRVGYMLFYGMEALIEDPLRIFMVWKGGMSFHGGMLGVLVAMGLYARKSGRRYFEVTDFIAPVIPVGLGFGRLGNFINAELPGRVADVPWAVVYPGDFVARHPSSLYQSLVEGPVLFAVLFIFARMPRPVMATSGVFLIGYGCLRVFSEFFRMPDAHLNFVALGWVTMGQILSLPMIAAGVVLVVLAYRLGLVARGPAEMPGSREGRAATAPSDRPAGQSGTPKHATRKKKQKSKSR